MAIAHKAHAGETEELKSDAFEPIDGAMLQAIIDEAIALENGGRADEALSVFQNAIEQHGNRPELLYNLGVAYQRRGMHREAVDTLAQINETVPAFAIAHNARGNSLQELGEFENAIAAYDEALSLNPSFPEALNNRGIACQSLGKWREAGENHVAAIQMAPGFVDAYNSLGAALIAITDYQAAIQVLDRAIEIHPNFRDAFVNRGMCLHQLGRHAEAVESFNRAIELTPGGPGVIDEAGSLARFNRGLAELHAGDFEAGWPDYEHRALAVGKPRRPVCDESTWRGENVIGGTIYVRTEQGFGDSIQFVRYLPKVRARCARVILECPPELVQLFTTCTGVDEIVVGPGAGRMWATPEGAQHVFVGSLPGIFKTRLTNIPNAVPYLTTTEERSEKWTNRIDAMDPNHASLRVGIVWAGSGANSNNARRSCTLSDFEPLVKIDGVKIFSLQKGEAAAALSDFPLADRIVDLSAEIDDFADTAAIVENLDLVISVDTAVVHLAGALARPVWTLIDRYCDWRWLRDREDTPWYPTMRLFRKIEPSVPAVMPGGQTDLVGSWRETMAKVAAELKAMKK